MFFLARYCKLLEENSFRGKTADFLYMLLFGATVLTGIVLIGGMIPYLSVSFSKIIFLSNSLTFMMVNSISQYRYFYQFSNDFEFISRPSITLFLCSVGLCME